MSHGGFSNAPSQFRMLCEQVGGIENGLPHTLRRLGIVGDDGASDFLQIQSARWLNLARIMTGGAIRRW